MSRIRRDVALPLLAVMKKCARFTLQERYGGQGEVRFGKQDVFPIVNPPAGLYRVRVIFSGQELINKLQKVVFTKRLYYDIM